MQKFLPYILLLILFTGNPFFYSTGKADTTESSTPDCKQLYADIKFGNIISYKALAQAIEGFKRINTVKKNIITLIDYSKPSTEKRFFVIDIKQRKLLFSSYVSHGRNSGENFATSFSNQNGSYKSSLGFYVTENPYKGKNGYSLVLNGLEKNINDNAKERAIVIHGAAYCNPAFINSAGRLGRSQGCPALPETLNDTIINTIKGGTLLFIYANNDSYLQQSPILSTPTASL